jgi:hypothetical protein
MAHHIVTELFFDFGDPVKVDILKMVGKFGDLFICHRQSQSLFIFGKGEPEAAPGGVLVLGGPDAAHLFTGIASGERIVVSVVFTAHDLYSLSWIVFFAYFIYNVHHKVQINKEKAVKKSKKRGEDAMKKAGKKSTLPGFFRFQNFSQ